MFTMTRLLGAAALAAMVSPAFCAEWMTDLEAAKAKAAAENKAVLVDFTGSDWCAWCVRLRQDVLDKPEFETYAADKFVLAEVDLPRAAKISAEQMERNRKIAEQYKVEGFPTIMVMTPAGQVLGGFEGFLPNVEAASEPLNAALANKAAYEAADKLEGVEKAKALYEIYKGLPDGLRKGSGLLERIQELDPQNSTGALDELLAEQQAEEFSKRLRAAGREPAAVLAVVESCLREARAENRADLLQLKVSLQLFLAQTEEDVLAAKQTMLQMAEELPGEAEAIRKAAEQRFADPAKVLESIRKQRGK